MIKVREGFIIRRMIDDYMILAVGDAGKNFRDIFQVNETGAFYWSFLEKGTTVNDMVKASMERFDDLMEEDSRKDIEEFLDNLKDAIEEI